MQIVLTGILPKLMEILVAPAAGEKVPPVEQLLVAAGAAATSIPAGKLSVTATFVSKTVFAEAFTGRFFTFDKKMGSGIKNLEKYCYFSTADFKRLFDSKIG